MSESTVWHEYRIGADTLPHQCVVCLKDLSKLPEPTRDNQSIAIAVGHEVLKVARCKECIRQSRWREWRIWFLVLLAANLLVPIVWLLPIDRDFLYVLIPCYSLLTLAIANYVTFHITGIMHVKTLAPGTLSLCFPNPNYRPEPLETRRTQSVKPRRFAPRGGNSL